MELFKATSGWLLTDTETVDESYDIPKGKHFLFIASLLALNY